MIRCLDFLRLVCQLGKASKCITICDFFYSGKLKEVDRSFVIWILQFAGLRHTPPGLFRKLQGVEWMSLQEEQYNDTCFIGEISSLSSEQTFSESSYFLTIFTVSHFFWESNYKLVTEEDPLDHLQGLGRTIIL